MASESSEDDEDIDWEEERPVRMRQRRAHLHFARVLACMYVCMYVN